MAEAQLKTQGEAIDLLTMAVTEGDVAITELRASVEAQQGEMAALQQEASTAREALAEKEKLVEGKSSMNLP